MSELRQALTRLRRRPGRSFVGVVTLALGIGASTAAFSAVRGVLLTPLPVVDQDALVVLWHQNPARDFAHIPFVPTSVDAVREGADFAQVAGFDIVLGTSVAEGTDGSFELRDAQVAGDFFGVLGARPAVGRLLDATDDETGAAPVAVVSHDFWVRSGGSDPGFVGSTLRFRGRSFTVVGVAERGLDLPRSTQVWTTLRGTFPEWDGVSPVAEMDLIARLDPGVAPGDAATRMNLLLTEHPDIGPGFAELTPVATPLLEHVVGPFESVLEAAMAVALLLLVVAVANATLVFLSGGARASRELAARRALGASRLRVIAPLLTDAGIVASAGALLGVVLASLIVDGLLPLAPTDMPRIDQIGLDAASAGFAVLVAALAMVGSGGVAGLWLSRGEAREALAQSGRGSTGGGEGLRRAIAIAQVSLAVVAAVGAGLLLRTVDNLDALERGFEPNGLHLVGLEHGHRLFEVPPSYVAELEELALTLASTPAVFGATPTINYPLDFNAGLEMAPTLEGQEAAESRTNSYVTVDAVLPEYFDLLGMELADGRTFEAEDRAESERVVVVNESAARAFWPDRRAVGQTLSVYPGEPDEWGTVVGVVADTRYRSFRELRPAVWVPLRQYASVPPSLLLVRTVDGVSVRDVVSGALADVAPYVRVTSVESMEDAMAEPLRLPRFAAAVLMTCALVTLLLTALGIYGVFAVLVQERHPELAVRRALGARDAHLLRFVVQRVLVVGAVGAALGVLLSLWLSTWVEALLFGVESGDAATVVAVLLGTLAAVVTAAGVPAVRAVRTDPASALRAD